MPNTYMNIPVGAAAGGLRGTVTDGDGRPVQLTACVSIGEFADEHGHPVLLLEAVDPDKGYVMLVLDFEATHALMDTVTRGFTMIGNALND